MPMTKVASNRMKRALRPLSPPTLSAWMSEQKTNEAFLHHMRVVLDDVVVDKPKLLFRRTKKRSASLKFNGMWHHCFLVYIPGIFRKRWTGAWFNSHGCCWAPQPGDRLRVLSSSSCCFGNNVKALVCFPLLWYTSPAWYFFPTTFLKFPDLFPLLRVVPHVLHPYK